MKALKYLTNINTVLFICVLFTISACKKENLNAPERRSFKPSSIKVTSGETFAKVEWQAPLFVKSKTGYTVEVSRDTTFSEGAEYTFNTDSIKLTISSDLLLRQKYFARIKANAIENVSDSKWITSSSFKITGIQIFTGTTVNDTELLLSWKETEGLTKVVLTPKGKPAIEIAVTTMEIANKRKLISSLLSSTEYEVEIFAGNQSMGYTNIRTKAPISLGNIVDLRLFASTSVLADTILKVPSGSTIILKRGLVYPISSTISLDRNLTIRSGDDLLNPNKAVILFNANFSIAANAVIDSLVFKDILLKGDNYTGRYALNINQKNGKVGKISVESCEAQIFRGFIRLQTEANTIDSIYINNSVIDSIADFGVIHNGLATSKVNNILISNSTIHNTQKFITGASTTGAIKILNCTFNNMPLGAAGTGTTYFIDYTASIAVTKLELTNSIIGASKVASGNNVVRGIRTGAGSSTTITNTYVTTDFVQGSNAIAIGANGLTAYANKASNLFTNTSGGNFTIKDVAFAGKSSSGDPRWRIQ